MAKVSLVKNLKNVNFEYVQKESQILMIFDKVGTYNLEMLFEDSEGN